LFSSTFVFHLHFLFADTTSSTTTTSIPMTTTTTPKGQLA